MISVEMQDVRSCLLFVANAVMGQSTCKSSESLTLSLSLSLSHTHIFNKF